MPMNATTPATPGPFHQITRTPMSLVRRASPRMYNQTLFDALMYSIVGSSTEVANCGCSSDSRSRARSTSEEQIQQASTPPVLNREMQQMDVMYVGSQFWDFNEDA
jgi:hypothetical protein